MYNLKQTSKRVRLPILDVKTRWNSVYLLLDRALLMRDAIHILANQTEMGLKNEALSFDQWTILEKVRDFLKIFKDVTLIMEGYKKPTLSYTVPLFDILVKNLTLLTRNTSDEIQEAAQLALNKVNAYYSSNTPIHYVATVKSSKNKEFATAIHDFYIFTDFRSTHEIGVLYNSFNSNSRRN